MKPHIKRVQLSPAGGRRWVWALYRHRNARTPIAMSDKLKGLLANAFRTVYGKKKGMGK